MNNIDFSEPRRLNTGGFVVEGILSFGKIVRSLGIMFIILVIRHREVFITWQFWLGLLGFFVLHFLFALLRHRNYRYFVDEELKEFVVTKGILNKTKIRIKFENILQVNIKQNVVQQALDLYAAEIESSGSKEKEVDLYALDEQTALELKAYLLQKNLGDETSIDLPPIADTKEELVFSIPNRNILLVSLLTNYKQGLGLFFAFLIGTIEMFDDFWSISDIEDLYHDVRFGWVDFVGVIATALFFVVLIPLIINLFKYFVRYYNFSLRRNTRGNLMMSFGLFHLQDVILNQNKVQMISFLQNRILRYFDIGVLSLHQVVTDHSKFDNATIFMPGVKSAARKQVWSLLFNKDIYEDLHVLKPKVVLLISRIVKQTLLFIVFAIAAFLYEEPIFYYVVPSLYVLFLLYNIIYYKTYTFFIGEGYIIKRDGVWDVRDTIVPVHKIATVSVSQTLWQKRSDTANLTVSTASGLVIFSFFERSQIATLSNQLLYQVEKN